MAADESEKGGSGGNMDEVAVVPVAAVCAMDEKAVVSVEECDGAANDEDDRAGMSGVLSEEAADMCGDVNGSGDGGTSTRRMGRRVADKFGPRRDRRGSEDDREGEAGTSEE